MQLNLIVIKTCDLEKSYIFYTLLGLTFIKEKHGDGPEHYSHTYNDITIELYPVKKLNDTQILGFNINSFEVLNNILYLGLIKEIPNITRETKNSKTYTIRDPNNNIIELKINN